MIDFTLQLVYFYIFKVNYMKKGFENLLKRIGVFQNNHLADTILNKYFKTVYFINQQKISNKLSIYCVINIKIDIFGGISRH